MTIDTLTVLKALGAETSGTDGPGAALDLGGDWGLIFAQIEVTAVAGSPPSALALDFEGSHDLANWYLVAKAPQLSTVGSYRVPIGGILAADRGTVLASTPDFRAAPRYIRKNSVVTAGGGGDSVTYSVHLTA